MEAGFLLGLVPASLIRARSDHYHEFRLVVLNILMYNMSAYTATWGLGMEAGFPLELAPPSLIRSRSVYHHEVRQVMGMLKSQLGKVWTTSPNRSIQDLPFGR